MVYAAEMFYKFFQDPPHIQMSFHNKLVFIQKGGFVHLLFLHFCRGEIPVVKPGLKYTVCYYSIAILIAYKAQHCRHINGWVVWVIGNALSRKQHCLQHAVQFRIFRQLSGQRIKKGIFLSEYQTDGFTKSLSCPYCPVLLELFFTLLTFIYQFTQPGYQEGIPCGVIV